MLNSYRIVMIRLAKHVPFPFSLYMMKWHTFCYIGGNGCTCRTGQLIVDFMKLC